MILASPDVDPGLREVLHREGLDTIDGAFAYAGGRDLSKPDLEHRLRTRLVVEGPAGRTHELYLKRYGWQRLRDCLWRLVRFAGTASPAWVEFRNIQAVRRAGIPTMREVICGQEGGCCGAGRSYIIVTAVPGDALERCGEAFLRRHEDEPEVVEDFTRRLGGLVRSLHRAGLCHRDLYASHVFLDERDGRADLYLIDLARAFRPRWRTFRWKVKDLAQLKHSMPPEWVAAWWEKFLSAYLGRDDEAAPHYNCAIDRKVAAMRRRRADKRGRSQG